MKDRVRVDPAAPHLSRQLGQLEALAARERTLGAPQWGGLTGPGSPFDLHFRRRAMALQHTPAADNGPPAATKPAPVGLLRRWLRQGCMALLHPAAAPICRGAFCRLALRYHAEQIRADLAAGFASRLSFCTADAESSWLDGMLLEPPLTKPVSEATVRPMLLVVVGFAMTYEMAYAEARAFAADYGLRIFLYNSRGVGRSLGVQHSLEQAVDDFTAAVHYARRQLGARQLGIYGISLGAALGVRGVQRLAQQGLLRAEPLGLFANVRGFSSIDRVVSARLGRPLGAAVRRLLAVARLDSLDMLQALQAPVPARRLLVTTAAADRLVSGAGQLAAGLRLADNCEVRLPSGQLATHVSGHGRGHNSRDLRTPLHDSILAAWAQEARRGADTVPPAAEADGQAG